MSFHYSRGVNKYDNAPAQITVSDFNAFVDAISTDLSETKGLTYICSPLSRGLHYERPEDNPGENHWRLRKYGLPRQFLAFDLDGFESPATYHEICKYFEKFNCLIYTTASHTEAEPRARVLLSLTRAITSLEGERLGLLAQKDIESRVKGWIKFDPSVYRATQPIYTPLISSIMYRNNGEDLDVDSIFAKNENTLQHVTYTQEIANYATPETSDNIKRLRSALSAIPANIDRKTWCEILYSTKSHGFKCGEDEAKHWSQSAGAYDKRTNPQGYDEKAFYDVWKYPVQSIGPGTVYYHAKSHGWLGYQAELFPTADLTNLSDCHGDVFNGKFFASILHGQYIYCYPRSKWLKFTGIRWEWCDSGEELNAAKQIALNIAHHAADLFKKDPTNLSSKKLIQHSHNTQNLSRLQAMLQTAASEPEMGIGNISQLDSNPMLLGCQNGVICLTSGSMLAPNPKMLITRQVNAEFHQDATCPTWLKFLNECFMGDQETISYIQKALGYSLTGLVSEEVLHFCFGMGRNGKSVFANVLTKIMGDYAVTAPAEMLMRRDRNAATNDIARLCGSRLVLANETRSDQRFDDLTIKTLVSTERISARFLHNEYFEFWPTFKIWIRGNHKPIIADDSNGAWRRIRLVPFENNIAEDCADPLLEDKLLLEKNGILLWMIEGSLKWGEEGLSPSNLIKTSSKEYRADCDILGEFLEEECVITKNGSTPQKTLWGRWQTWSQLNGHYVGSKKRFTRKLKDREIEAGFQGGVRTYVGINLAKIL